MFLPILSSLSIAFLAFSDQYATLIHNDVIFLYLFLYFQMKENTLFLNAYVYKFFVSLFSAAEEGITGKYPLLSGQGDGPQPADPERVLRP